MEITKEFAFDAAHRLLHVEKGHPCRCLHGHRYRVTVHLNAPWNSTDDCIEDIDSTKTMIVDYRDLSFIKEWLDEKLDHATLIASNDINLQHLAKTEREIFGKTAVLPLRDTTAELLALYLQDEFVKLIADKRLPVQVKVTVCETPNTSASTEYTGTIG